MKRRSIWIIAIIALLLTAGGGYFAYTRHYSAPAQTQEPPEPAVETATVTHGDVVITAEGSGELVPARELELSSAPAACWARCWQWFPWCGGRS